MNSSKSEEAVTDLKVKDWSLSNGFMLSLILCLVAALAFCNPKSELGDSICCRLCLLMVPLLKLRKLIILFK